MADLRDVELVIRKDCEVCDGSSGEVLDDHGERPRTCGVCGGSGRVDGQTLTVGRIIDAVLAEVPKTVLSRDALQQVIDDLNATITAAAQRSRGLADADEAQDNLRTVQEAAEALRAVADLLREDG